jgi:flagellar FliJ protein
MRRFNFKLEPVLRYRGMIEEQRKMDFAREAASYERALKALEDIRNRIGEVEREFRSKNAEGMTAAEARIYLYYLSSLREIERIRHEEFEAASRKMEEARVKLMRARRDRKIIETLKDRAFELYREEVKRGERKLIDEVSANKVARSSAIERLSP